MKICPYCSGQLEDDDVKCRYCGEWIIKRRSKKSPRKKGRGSRRTVTFVILLLAAWGIYAAVFSPETPVDEPGNRAYTQSLKTELETLAILEEGYFQEHGAYTGRTLALGFAAPEGVIISLTATPSGWSATATREGYPADVGCAVYGGTAAPPRSPVVPQAPGIVVCTG